MATPGCGASTVPRSISSMNNSRRRDRWVHGLRAGIAVRPCSACHPVPGNATNGPSKQAVAPPQGTCTSASCAHGSQSRPRHSRGTVQFGKTACGILTLRPSGVPPKTGSRRNPNLARTRHEGQAFYRADAVRLVGAGHGGFSLRHRRNPDPWSCPVSAPAWTVSVPFPPMPWPH